ncbi:MAG: efflux RND transporter permease subunit [Saccharospirillaceae bacterium]|nr:hypothetical protein [Pseudomonadales bacterium]NRB78737.1 efflux RND transporter permease subunit [Saccharospirillaceae bacterium]
MNKFKVHSKFKVMLTILLCSLLSLFVLKNNVEPLDRYKTIILSVYWPDADVSTIRNNIGINIESRLKSLNRHQEIYSTGTDESLTIYFKVKNNKNVNKTIDIINAEIKKLNIPNQVTVSTAQRLDIQKEVSSVLLYGSEDIDYLSTLAYQVQKSLLNNGFDSVEIAGDLKKKTTLSVSVVDLVQLNMDLNNLSMAVKNTLENNTLTASFDKPRSGHVLKQQSNKLKIKDLNQGVLTLDQILSIKSSYSNNQELYFYNNQRAIKIDMINKDSSYFTNLFKVNSWIDHAQTNLPEGVSLKKLNSESDKQVNTMGELLFKLMLGLILALGIIRFILKLKISHFNLLSIIKIIVVVALISVILFKSIHILFIYGLLFAFIFILIKEVFSKLLQSSYKLVNDMLITGFLALIVYFIIDSLSSNRAGFINVDYLRVYIVSIVCVVVYYIYKLICSYWVADSNKDNTKMYDDMSAPIIKHYQSILKYCIEKWKYSSLLLLIFLSIVVLVVNDKKPKNYVVKQNGVIEFNIQLHKGLSEKQALNELSSLKDAVIEYDFTQGLKAIDEIVYKIDDYTDPKIATLILYLKPISDHKVNNNTIYKGVIEVFESTVNTIGVIQFNDNKSVINDGEFVIHFQSAEIDELKLAMDYTVEILAAHNDFINVESNIKQDKQTYKLELNEYAINLGLEIGVINRQLSTLFDGVTIQNGNANNDFNTIIVKLDKDISDYRIMFENLPIKVGNEFYPLSVLVSIEYQDAYSVVNSENGQVVGQITSDYLGYLNDTEVVQFLNGEILNDISTKFDISTRVNDAGIMKVSSKFIITIVMTMLLLIVFYLLRIRKISKSIKLTFVSLSVVPALYIVFYIVYKYFDIVNVMTLIPAMILSYIVVTQFVIEYFKSVDFKLKHNDEILKSIISASTKVFYPYFVILLLIFCLFLPIAYSSSRDLMWVDLFFKQFIFILVFCFIYQIIVLPSLLFNCIKLSIKDNDNNY